MDTQQFQIEIYSIVKQIPAGRVVTYGQLARLAGKPQCSRMAGHALSCVPPEMRLPCHRVVNSQGRTAPGWEEQVRLLEAEGVSFKKNGCVDLKKSTWEEIL